MHFERGGRFFSENLGNGVTSALKRYAKIRAEDTRQCVPGVREIYVIPGSVTKSWRPGERVYDQ